MIFLSIILVILGFIAVTGALVKLVFWCAEGTGHMAPRPRLFACLAGVLIFAVFAAGVVTFFVTSDLYATDDAVHCAPGTVYQSTTSSDGDRTWWCAPA